ncbi:MAG: FAD binding domain-containing protein [Candidatus Neomarinimicrobiota bacterium]
MWKSIENILFPDSFEDAQKHANISKVFFAGGTYLVSEKNISISTLIDINQLIGKSIYVDEKTSKVTIEAGATLQQLSGWFSENHQSDFDDIIKSSCPSKNIRNQRTIGGEIAQARRNSEFYLALMALNVSLTVHSSTENILNLRDWNGAGVISQIKIPLDDLLSLSSQRFSVLPSAPAFMVIAVSRKVSAIDIVIGGKCSKITSVSVKKETIKNEDFEPLIKAAAKNFFNDHYGSITYKSYLLKTGLKRIESTL